MAEQERMTNKERRAKAREERKRKEAEAARRRKVSAIRNGLIAALVAGVVAAVVLQAFLGGPDTIDDPVTVGFDEVEDGRQAAGCEMLAEESPLAESGHLPLEQLRAAEDEVYPEIRPTHSGPHTAEVHPIISDGASSQIDEFVSTHNLEHGSVIAWYDPEQVDDGTIAEMESWSATLNESGFQQGADTGTAIFVSPYEDPGLSSGKAIALRAWGTAMDCDDWDETVANGFVAEHYGTRGVSPERTLAPYPDGTIEFRDAEQEDTPEDEAPVEEDPTVPDEAGGDAEDAEG